ncbi:hypothetical protein KSF73_10645 [Burkholderiaceae bacterium DAT-1]|nr:hypothetical protein [Burkholderiaceae bacterium DAT-1]
MFNKWHLLKACLVLAPGFAAAGTLYETQAASNVTDTTARLNGNAQSSVGVSGEFFFWGTSPDNLNKSGVANPQGVQGPVTLDVSGLNCATTYYFKFLGDPKPPFPTVQGEVLSFATAACKPAVGTGTSYQSVAATNITSSSAQLNGFARSIYGVSGTRFVYGPTTSYGNTALTSQQGVQGPQSATISGLNCGSVYHYAFQGDAKPPLATVQGKDLSFTTQPCTNTVVGFTGPFAADKWLTGSNSPINLVDFSAMPERAVLRNYQPWYQSGAVMEIPSMPYSGRVTFSYTVSNVTDSCPPGYMINNVMTSLPLSDGNAQVNVRAGEAFRITLNGSASDMICRLPGVQATFSIYNFRFTAN